MTRPLDPLPPDAQAVIAHTAHHGLVPEPTRFAWLWLITAYAQAAITALLRRRTTEE